MIVTVDLFTLVELGLLTAALLVVAITHAARWIARGLRRWWSGPAD